MIIIDDHLKEGDNNFDNEKFQSWLEKMCSKRLNTQSSKIVIIHGDSPEGKKLAEELKKQFDKLNDPNFK